MSLCCMALNPMAPERSTAASSRTSQFQILAPFWMKLRDNETAYHEHQVMVTPYVVIAGRPLSDGNTSVMNGRERISSHHPSRAARSDGGQQPSSRPCAAALRLELRSIDVETLYIRFDPSESRRLTSVAAPSHELLGRQISDTGIRDREVR